MRDNINISHQRDLKQAMREFLASKKFTHCGTAVFNRETCLNAGLKKLRHWHALLDRALLGHRWAKAPLDKRTFFIAFPEHIDSNLHYHILIDAKVSTITCFEQLAKKIWVDSVKSGSFDIQALYDDYGAALYATKGIHQIKAWENFVVSSEFSGK